MPSANLRQIQGEALHPRAMGDTALTCSGWIPWIDSQGARQAQRQQTTMSMMMATATTTTIITMMAAMATTKMKKKNMTAVTTTTKRQRQRRRQHWHSRGQRWQWGNDNEMVTRTNGWQRCNGDGRLATRRTLASAVPPIWGNNQLMLTVWGEVDERKGQFFGAGQQKRVEVEEIE